MSLFLAILPILGALVPFAVNQFTRYQAKRDDPKTKNENAYAQIDKEIAGGNSEALTAGGGADLDELDRLQRAGGGGQR